MKTTLRFILILIVTAVHAQVPAVSWQKNFGGSNNDYSNCIAQTSDGGYIVGGTTASNDGDVIGFYGMYDYWILKLDASGNMQWQQTLGGNGDERPYGIFQTADDGYMIAGQSDLNEAEVTGNHGGYDLWIVKLSANGTMEWQKSIGGSDYDLPEAMAQTADGNYIIAGGTLSNDGDVGSNYEQLNCWIVKINSSGTILWQKTFGGSSADIAYDVSQTADGGCIFIGATNSNDGDVSGNHGDWDLWVVKLNLDGGIEWQKPYGGTFSDIGSSISQCADGGYIVGGNTQSYDGDAINNTMSLNSWVMKLDATGTIQWSRHLADSGCQNDANVKPAADGGFIVAGAKYTNDPSAEPIGLGSEDIYLGKLNANGELLWSQILGTASHDHFGSVLLTSDNGCVLTGSVYSYANPFAPGSNLWVAKVEADVLANQAFVKPQFGIYPNPASNVISIQSETTIEKVTVIDVLGKTVFIQNGNERTINVEQLPSGIYLLEAVSGNKSYTSKFIKQ